MSDRPNDRKTDEWSDGGDADDPVPDRLQARKMRRSALFLGIFVVFYSFFALFLVIGYALIPGLHRFYDVRSLLVAVAFAAVLWKIALSYWRKAANFQTHDEQLDSGWAEDSDVRDP